MNLRLTLSSFTLLLLASLASMAGGMSDIDLEVRETIMAAYSQAPDGYVAYDDIWGLDFAPKEEGCDITVTGFASKPTPEGRSNHKFWVCLNRTDSNFYRGEFFKDEKVIVEPETEEN